MSPNHQFYRQPGDSFEQARRIFVYSQQHYSEEPQMELAGVATPRTPDDVAVLKDPNCAEDIPAEQCDSYFQRFWNASNQTKFQEQNAETTNHWAGLQGSPDQKEMPQFAAVTQLETLSVAQSANLTDISYHQTAYYESLYGQSGLSDLPDAQAEKPITEKIAQVPAEEQREKIESIIATQGMEQPTEQEWEVIKNTLVNGGTVVADIAGMPVVIGAGTGADVSKDTYVLSQNGKGLLSGGSGSGGGGGNEGADQISLSKAESESSKDEDAKKKEETYNYSVHQHLAGGFDNTTFDGPLVKINTEHKDIEHFRGRAKTAVVAASSVPIHSPLKEKPWKDDKTQETGIALVGNYTTAEKRLITSLSQDERVRTCMLGMERFKDNFDGARDLLAMRFTPATQNILTQTVDLSNPRELFGAIRTVLDNNPDLRTIAEQNFKRQLLTMKPRQEEHKKLQPYIHQLDMMKCLEDPKKMSDLVSAHLKGELPLFALEEDVEALKAKGRSEPGLQKK